MLEIVQDTALDENSTLHFSETAASNPPSPEYIGRNHSSRLAIYPSITRFQAILCIKNKVVRSSGHQLLSVAGLEILAATHIWDLLG